MHNKLLPGSHSWEDRSSKTFEILDQNEQTINTSECDREISHASFFQTSVIAIPSPILVAAKQRFN